MQFALPQLIAGKLSTISIGLIPSHPRANCVVRGRCSEVTLGTTWNVGLLFEAPLSLACSIFRRRSPGRDKWIDVLLGTPPWHDWSWTGILPVGSAIWSWCLAANNSTRPTMTLFLDPTCFRMWGAWQLAGSCAHFYMVRSRQSAGCLGR